MEDEFIDEGSEFAPTVKENDTQGGDAPEFSLKADSAEETKTEEPIGEKAEEPTDSGEKVSETEAKEGDKEDSDDDSKSLDEVLADVDKEIADDKHPKWYKANLGAVKKAFMRETEALKATYEPLKDFGEVENVIEKLELVKGLEAIEIGENNLPTRTVKPFVEAVIKKHGAEIGVALFNELAQLDSPYNTGRKVVHDLIAATGLDPTRLEDYKRFQENGYQLGKVENEPDPEDLAYVPKEYREAFLSCGAKKRDDLLIKLLSEDQDDIEDAKEQLANRQIRLDSERKTKEEEAAKAQTLEKEKIQQEQKFYQEVNERTFQIVDQYGGSLFDSFTKSLVDANVDEVESVAFGSMVSMMLNGDGVEAKAAKTVLEKAGVAIDASLISTFNDWNKAAQNLAFFEKQNDEKNAKLAKDHLDELQLKLTRKANPIIASLATFKNGKAKSEIQSKNNALTEITNNNTGLKAGEGKAESIQVNQPITDFSDSAYAASEF